MINKQHNNGTRFEDGKNRGLTPNEAPIVRDIVTVGDSALGFMFGVASRSVYPHQYSPNPAFTAGSHDNLGVSEEVRAYETAQLNTAFEAPAATEPQQAYTGTDLDLAAIRARIATEVSTNA